jgi:hypothetical protein
LNPNNFVARPQIEPRLIQGHNILPIAVLYGLQESEQFVWSIDSNLSLCICEAMGDPV